MGMSQIWVSPNGMICYMDQHLGLAGSQVLTSRDGNYPRIQHLATENPSLKKPFFSH